MVKKLTVKEQAFYEEMEEAILNKEFALYNSNWFDRAWGKTTVINEIGFTYQALGFEVYVLTPINCVEYYASKRISNKNDLRGIKRDNLIVLVDEESSQSDLLGEIQEFCDINHIPMVGFVRY